MLLHLALHLYCSLLAQASACAFLDKDEKLKASLKDAELSQQFKAVEQFTDGDKNVVKKLIDAFVVKKQLQLMAS